MEEKKINDDNNKKFDYSKELEQLISMGFDKVKAYEAINFAKGNIELAIEYVYNGIPKNDSNNNLNSSMDVNVGDSDEDDDNKGEDYEDITYLLKKASSIIKILANEKKKTIQQILEILQKVNFKLFQFIKENEDEFNEYISIPIIKDDYELYTQFKKGEEKLGYYNLDYKIFDQDFNNNNIIIIKKESDSKESLGNDLIEHEIENDDINNLKGKLSGDDKIIIEKLKMLGNFTEDEIIQAFFICDRNEEITANYLFENSVINKK